MPGRSYQVQYKREIDDSYWVSLPSNFVVSGARAVAMDLVDDGGAQRFYHLVHQP